MLFKQIVPSSTDDIDRLLFALLSIDSSALDLEQLTKKGVGLGLSFSKNLRYMTAVSLQKLTPDVIGYTAIYFNLDETPQM